MESCPCTPKPFNICCEPYIKGERLPSTPEQLMRSRYSAFVIGDIDYIFATMSGDALKDSDYESTKLWASESDWQGLNVVEASPVSAADCEGYVTFVARYLDKNGVEQEVREKSRFLKKEDGKWYYVSGTQFKQNAISNKVGRNDPCPCGSGKKYKKCCV